METDTDIVSETRAERARLVSVLENLDPDQWAGPSLCAGWRVREVVAHLTMPFRNSPLRFMGGMVRAGFSFDRYADRAARIDTKAMSDDELLALLRTNIRHPWRPPGGGAVGALGHDVIHGLDITVPLALPSPPLERIALVLRHSTSRSLKYFGALGDGKRLVATDVDLTVGEGSPVRMPVTEILRMLTGRRDFAGAPVRKVEP